MLKKGDRLRPIRTEIRSLSLKKLKRKGRKLERTIFSFQYLVAVISKKKEYRFVPKKLKRKGRKVLREGCKIK